MIILVGGNGFVGRHISGMLSSMGESCCIVSRQNIHSKSDHDKLQYLHPDNLSTIEGRDYVTNARAIVYLVTTSVPNTFFNEPWLEMSNNVSPAFEFFEECAKINPKAKIVFISSGGTVYGRVGSAPADEKLVPAPISAYGLGKLVLEECLKFSSRSWSRPFNILRLSNPVGIHQKSITQGIVPIAMRSILENRKFTIFGDGSNVRDYVDADDVAEAVLAACNDTTHNSETWNVGSGLGHSINEIIKIVQDVSGEKLDIDFQPGRSVDVPSIVLNTQKIKSDLNWTCKRPIAESCSKVWTHLNSTHLKETCIMEM
jgi:UDP-glucose 4-epimerase